MGSILGIECISETTFC